MNQPIERATAKAELVRINNTLQQPHILIGGLAVHHYITTRDSSDIDLVCEFDTFNKILKELYPTSHWKINNSGNDYRPSIEVTHRWDNFGIIRFGPKITEREPYKYIKWADLFEGATSFNSDGKSLKNILVPLAHSLAFTKLISIISRSIEKKDKIVNDINDFVSLTNHETFSMYAFYNLLNATYEADQIILEFKARTLEHGRLLDVSSLKFLCKLFYDNFTPPSTRTTTNSTQVLSMTTPSVYIAAPHKNSERNERIERYLSMHGINVKVPEKIVQEKLGVKGDTEKKEYSEQVRQICIDAIKDSDFIVIDLDSYGLDSAWELGFAEACNKTIIGFNEDVELATKRRTFKRKKYTENFMHGWQTQKVTRSIDVLSRNCKDKEVYVIGPFENKALDYLKEKLKGTKNVVFPKDIAKKGKKPQEEDFSFNRRAENNKLLSKADVVVVVLPRYGMDAAFQVGYAFGRDKTILGIVLEDDRKEQNDKTFWENWMHGWKHKLRVTRLDELVAFVRGSYIANTEIPISEVATLESLS